MPRRGCGHRCTSQAEQRRRRARPDAPAWAGSGTRGRTSGCVENEPRRVAISRLPEALWADNAPCCAAAFHGRHVDDAIKSPARDDAVCRPLRVPSALRAGVPARRVLQLERRLAPAARARAHLERWQVAHPARQRYGQNAELSCRPRPKRRPSHVHFPSPVNSDPSPTPR
jgi:hypothetical protein